MSTVFSHAQKLDAEGIVDDFWMLVDVDTIASTGTGTPPAADNEVNVDGQWLTPGFIDLHGHGGGGFSYEDGADAIRAAVAAHRAHGTTRSVISLVSNPLPELETSLGIIAELAESDPLILGSHLEGPFLSPTRSGAHNRDYLLEPQPAELDRLLNAARGTLRQMTLAPELPNAFDLINVLVENRVVVAIGHTEADFDLTKRAFRSGARLLTHAFNAMPGIGHRAPGPVVAALEDGRVVLELILDGEHVHPDVAALAFRSAPGRIALVTDAMAAAGAGDGDYPLGSLAVEVRDGLAHLAGTDTLAGSTLTQDRALRLAIEDGLTTFTDAIAAVTLTPAKVLGLSARHGLLATGFAADGVQLNSEWNVQHVWADGAQLS
jgi:N-acetylglucosamine-6-phosphate deacetylase